MSSIRAKLWTRFLMLVALAVFASRPAEAADQSYVKRGTVERHGRAWVERSECTASVREGGKLVLRADFGSVAVRTGPSDRMECQVGVVLRAYTASEQKARRYFEGFELSVRTLDGGGVYVGGKCPSEHGRSLSMDAEFIVTVPPHFNLDIETQGGDVTVERPLQGEIRATTAGGDIRTKDVSGLLHAETAGGSIMLGNIGNGLKAETAGGSIQVGDVKGDTTLETSGGEIVTGQVDGTLNAETAGGDVVIGGATGSVVAQTAGGQIRIGPAGGSVRAETAGGSIWLQGARGRVVVETAGGSIDLFKIQGAIRASTAAGRILAQIDANRKTFGASELETSMGDVQVFLPPDLSLTIDAAIEMAAGHRILSDFPLEIQGEQAEFVEGEIRGRGALNGGGEVLRIRTENGNIEIRKLDSQTLNQLKERQDADWNRWESRRVEKEQRQREREERHREHEHVKQ